MIVGMTLALAVQVVSVQDVQVDSSLNHTNGRVPPAVVAVRTRDDMRVDGVLDEPVWSAATPARGFRRDEPSDGKPPAESTTVYLVFDDNALYVGARLFTADTAKISRRLDRRDSFATLNDRFFVILDAFHDHRTSFAFGVTPAGERSDATTSNDTRMGVDPTWNPVWEAETAIDSAGWIAEMRIPFSQIRFSTSGEQVWGIQLRRDIFHANEAADWAWTPATEPGWVSKFGHLMGLDIGRQPMRLEVLPYTVTQGQFTEDSDPANPFDDGSRYRISGGADIKYGISSDFTLDATINPDFGQVDADPAVVNLTAFETLYPELRPFFVEGSNIFNFGIGGHDFFYSRRIGRAPQKSAVGAAAYVDMPRATTILGAAKVSGKTQNGWSIGVLEALTNEEKARTASSTGAGLDAVSVEPLTNYGVVRARKDMREGAGQVGFALTTVHRDISDPIFESLSRSAYSGGIDFTQRFNDNAYSIDGIFSFAHIEGEPAAMLAVQRSSGHYFQRPDQDHLALDSSATSMSGTLGMLSFAETEGNWTFNAYAGYSSPGIEINDIGYQRTADRRVAGGGMSRRWLRPSRTFRSFRIGTSGSSSWNHGGVNLSRTLRANLNAEFHNHWRVSVSGGYALRGLSDRETRGGPLIEEPEGWNASLSIHTDTRRPLSLHPGISVVKNVAGGWLIGVRPGITVRSSGALRIRFQPAFTRLFASAQYVTQAVDPHATATFGGRYVFGTLDQSNLDLTTRVDVALTPALTLQLYAQPLVASGDYVHLMEFATPRTYEFIEYGQDGNSSLSYDSDANTYTADSDGAGPGEPLTFRNPDFSIRSLRTNMVLRWEYLPGSTLFLAWSHSRFAHSSDPSFRVFDELKDLLSDDQQNVLMVKMTYWLSF